MSEYSEKLKDPRWQKLRLEVMQRDQFKCVECGRDDRHLNVHHPRYKRGLAPWEYPSRELVTLCQECHETAHRLKDEVSFLIHELKLDVSERILSALRRAARRHPGSDPLALLQAAVCEAAGSRMIDRIFRNIPSNLGQREADAVREAIAKTRE